MNETKKQRREEKKKKARRAAIAPGMQGDPLFDPCVKCTICVQACPVVAVTDQFPGPKQAGPDAQRFRQIDEDAVDDWIEYCTACRRCEIACPSNVPIAKINILAKFRHAMQRGLDLPTLIMNRSFLFGDGGSLLAPLANRTMNNRVLRKLSQVLAGIDARRPLPHFSFTTFDAWAKTRAIARTDRRVVYFHGCYTNNNAPEIGRITVRLLEALGHEVIIPEQYCCGAAMIGAGDLNAARDQARRNIEALTPYAEQGLPILVTSTSCCLALAHEYDDVLGMKEAAPMAAQVRDLMEYLGELLDDGLIPPPDHEVNIRAHYHTACHQQALGIGTPATVLLSQIPGVEIRLLDGGCCGLGGTYGFKKGKYDVSQAIGEKLARRAEQVGAELIVTECEGCRMQISTLTGVPCKHPVEILAQGYGVEI